MHTYIYIYKHTYIRIYIIIYIYGWVIANTVTIGNITHYLGCQSRYQYQVTARMSFFLTQASHIFF